MGFKAAMGFKMGIMEGGCLGVNGGYWIIWDMLKRFKAGLDGQETMLLIASIWFKLILNRF